MSKSNVNPNHYKVAGRERPGEDILQIRHKQKQSLSMVRARSTPHTKTEGPALIPGPPPRGAAPIRAAVRRVKKTSKTAAGKKPVVTQTSARKPGSAKRAKRPTARKRVSSRS